MTKGELIPSIALSVRQPWAWAIIHGGKTHENRSGAAVGYMGAAVGKRIAIHASLGMTRNEYIEALEVMRDIGVTCPAPHLLDRGGIIGSVLVTRITLPKERPASRWFFGPRALELADAMHFPFVGCKGALGLFKPEPNGASPDAPAPWMLPKTLTTAAAEREADLFGGK